MKLYCLNPDSKNIISLFPNIKQVLLKLLFKKEQRIQNSLGMYGKSVD